MLRPRGDTDKARTGSQGGLAGQTDCTAHTEITADYQYVAEVTLVCRLPARCGQQPGWSREL